VRRSLWLALWLPLWGCAGGPAVGERAQAIVGGTSDPGDPGVVAIVAQVPGATQESLCTGEVISPHVVLTAAHCVAAAEVGANARFTVHTGATIGATSANTFAVKEVHANSAWNPQDLFSGHDVGVVILAAPLAVTPLRLHRVPLTSADKGAPVRLVGYGLSAAQTASSAGVKREAAAALNDFDPALVSVGDAQHGTCNGDSGGPAFLTVGAVEEVVGVTSFGDQACSQGNYDTRVDVELPFIDPYVAANDPSPADGGTTLQSGAGPGEGGVGDGPDVTPIAAVGPEGMPTGPPGPVVHGGCAFGGAAQRPGRHDGSPVALWLLFYALFFGPRAARGSRTAWRWCPARVRRGRG
jgi:V8-like Glu-specific endopeptidase